MFKNILVCLDGSKLAEQILPYVKDEALLHKSRMVLIQVVPSPVVVTPGVPGVAGGAVVSDITLRQSERTRQEAESYLNNLAEEMRGTGLKAEVAIEIGSPGQKIIDYAEKNNIDLIALATHGRSGLGRAIFGSVADFVLKGSGMPVLLIKPKKV